MLPAKDVHSVLPLPGAAAPANGHITELLSAHVIAEKVAAMGAAITADYQGKEMVLVAVLKGSFLFYGDLIRQIDVPLSCEFIGISSYGHATKSSGVVQITTDLTESITGKDVLLVEDIVDTGLSMRYLLDNFATRKPASLKVCSLLVKPANLRIDVPIDYRGFDIGNEFVVGYGLDLKGQLRNLPYIGVYHGT